jgi:predicted alpha/beta hydrolase
MEPTMVEQLPQEDRTTAPPEHGIDPTLRLPATDGYPLAATLYQPAAGSLDAAVVISSATAVRRGYYDPFARYLAGRGFAVLTYDYRGIGDSRPASLRGFRARLLDWGERDLAGVLDWAALQLRPARLLMVGHSVGGQLLGLAESARRVDGLLAVAAQSGYWGHWSGAARWQAALRWHLLMPALSRAFGYLPGWTGIKEDLPDGVAREWAAWCRRREYLLTGHPERRAGFDRFDRPILSYGFSDDPYAPRPAIEGLLAFYRNTPATHREIAPRDLGVPAIGHFGFFREAVGAALWPQVTDWLEERARA